MKQRLFGYPATLANAILLGGVVLIAVGCSNSRKVQCQSISNVTRHVQNKVMAVHQQRIGKPVYAAKFDQQLSTVMSDSAEAIRSLEVKDKTLQALQTRLGNSYQQSSTLYQQSAELLLADENPSDSVIQQVDALRRQVDADLPDAIHELNVYCIGG